MVPILANLFYLVVNLVSYCGKHNPLNAYTYINAYKIIVFYFIGPDVSDVLDFVEQFIWNMFKKPFRGNLRTDARRCEYPDLTTDTCMYWEPSEI